MNKFIKAMLPVIAGMVAYEVLRPQIQSIIGGIGK